MGRVWDSVRFHRNGDGYAALQAKRRRGIVRFVWLLPGLHCGSALSSCNYLRLKAGTSLNSLHSQQRLLQHWSPDTFSSYNLLCPTPRISNLRLDIFQPYSGLNYFFLYCTGLLPCFHAGALWRHYWGAYVPCHPAFSSVRCNIL